MVGCKYRGNQQRRLPQVHHRIAANGEYLYHPPISWYTYNCFLYSMLNRALRTMEVELIIKMGFFVRDLHEHLAALHTEQYGGHSPSTSFTVYRGQGLPQTDFDQLKKTQDGLLFFNNFLSISKNRGVSLKLARRTTATSDLVGILFVMKLDPSIPSTSFTNIHHVTYFEGEKKYSSSYIPSFASDK